MKTFYITTLGCKVNQYESDGIAAELISGGWRREKSAKEADVCIINTCAVTSRAAMQSRQQIRSIIRSNPAARVVVTGCHAQTAPDEIRKIEQVDIIAGHQEKFQIAKKIIESVESEIEAPPSLNSHTLSSLESLDNHKSLSYPEKSADKLSSESSLPICSESRFEAFKPAVTGDKTRAYLKIQDGCNSFCTYCIVPYARGRSCSMPTDGVIEHLSYLGAKGYMEAILTGIHVGAYGLDLEKRSSLTDLMVEINRVRPIHRVRLSSIEPAELTGKIISLASRADFKNSSSARHLPPNEMHNPNVRPCLCDHFHIPLQSGDDTILKQMGRPYDSALFSDLIMHIHHAIPTAAIGVDILEGFPGESDKAFENTLNLIEKLPVTYLHVFPFSPREGTPAFSYPDKVETPIVKKRCAILRKLGFQKRRTFENRQMGAHLESVIQEMPDGETGKLVAVTSNYLSVVVDGDDQLKRKVVDIELTGRDNNNRLIGRVL